MMLKQQWQWYFMVKVMNKFNLQNFKESYAKLGEPTSSIDELIEIKNNFSPVSDLKNCNISLFKSHIEPVWEDEHNRFGNIIELFIEHSELNFNWFVSYVLANEDIVNGMYIKI